MMLYPEERLKMLLHAKEIYSLLVDLEDRFDEYKAAKKQLHAFLQGMLVPDEEVQPLPFTFQQNKQLGELGYPEETTDGVLEILTNLEMIQRTAESLQGFIKDIFDEESFENRE